MGFTGMLIVLADTGLDPTESTGTAINQEQILQWVIGIVIPILVALVTKKVADSSRFKAILLLVLNLVSATLTEALGSGSFVWQQMLVGFLLSFTTGVAALYGLWKPTGVSDSAYNTLRKD